MTDPLRAFRLRPHLLASISATLAVALVLPGPPAGSPLLTRLLLGWSAGVAVYAAFPVRRATGQSRDALRREAARLDDSAAIISVSALMAAAATSDTNIPSERMRRIATVQTVCAYLFATGILALAVDMAAGFVPH